MGRSGPMLRYGDRKGYLCSKSPCKERGGQNERRRTTTNLIGRVEQANSVFQTKHSSQNSEDNSAKKIHKSQRQKKNLDGLYEVLTPGSTVCKISPTTGVIKEPNRQKVRVRNSDIAKFGARMERDTDLGQYTERTEENLRKNG